MDDSKKAVLGRIDALQDEIIKFHQQIVRIPSENPPANYDEIAKFTANKIKQIGLEVEIRRNNVVGKIRNNNNKHTLILYGHYDTVEAFKGWTEDPFGGEIIDGKIYGRGSSDDKSCVTAEIFAIQAILDTISEFSGNLTLTAVGDEELGGLAGAHYLLSNKIVKGDACLLGDSPFGYPIGYCGGGMFPIFVIQGKQSHGMGFPDLPKPLRNEYSGINAIQKMVKVMNFLLEMKKELNMKETKYPLPPSYSSKVSDINLAVINGGTKISIVPDRCVLQTSINTVPEQDIKSLKNKILQFMKNMKEEDPFLDISVQIPIVYEPQVIDKNSKFAKAVKNAFKIVFNEERDFKLFIPTTDAHWFQERGIETILVGCTRGDNNVHTKDEFVYIEDLIDLTKIYALTVLNYFK
jgi:acetylornithine deacetylase/succinyl-diaminopimelate desuccinylase-like protein